MLKQFDIIYKNDTRKLHKICIACINKQMARIRFEQQYGNEYQFVDVYEVR